MRKGLLALCLFTTIFCFAQQDTRNTKLISGNLVNSKKEVISGATITVMSSKDNKLVTVNQTDSNGYFHIPLPDSLTYSLIYSAVGFDDYHINNINFNDSNCMSLPTVVLTQHTKQMNEVVVKATRPLIEHKLDHLNFNVATSPFLQGLNAIEAIGEAPGIEVTADGTILYNRKAVLVLIDGKQTFLTGDALAGYLRGLMAGNIDHVEFYSIPPSRFNAGGGGPIINIITKRIKPGLQINTNTTYTQGRYPGFGQSVSINFEKKKAGFLFMYNYSNVQSYYQTTSTKQFYAMDTLSSFSNESAFSKYKNINQLVKGAMDYYLNKKITIGLMFTARLPYTYSSPQVGTSISNPFQSLLYQERTQSNISNKATSVLGNVNLTCPLDAASSLSMNMDYSNYKQDNHQFLNTQFFPGPGDPAATNLTLLSAVPATIKVAVGEVNYQAQHKTLHVEAGLKSSWVQSDNAQEFERNYGGLFIKDNRSNHFIYTEAINAAYGTLTKEGKKLKISAGIRAEQTRGTGNQLTTGYSFVRDTLNFFPSVFMQWKANPGNEFSFSVGKRIGRPNYMDLNPFIEIQDSLNYFQGNPYLRPYYIYNYSISHSYKNFLFSSLEYSDYRNMYANITYYNPNNQVTLHTIENVNALKLTVLTVNLVKTVWNKFNVNFSNQVYQTDWNFTRQNQTNNLVKTSYYGDLKLSQSLKKGFSYQVEGVYLTQSLDMLVYTGKRGYFNVSFLKKVLNNNGLLKLDVIDPFKLFYITGTLKYQDINEYDTNHFGNQRVRFSFTYNFAKGSTKIKNRSTGSEDIQSRIGK